MAGCVTFWGQSRFDSPSPVLQASPGFQGLLGEPPSPSRDWRARFDSAALASPTPDFKLKESAARIGDAGTTGRLTSSEVLVLASSNTMPLEPFFSCAP